MSDGNPYRVVRELGSGLFGTVYLAETESGLVALRRFKPPSPAGSSEAVDERKLFIAAAHSVSVLDQARIVQILEVIDDEDENEAYAAMEYIAGETLESALNSQRFTPEEANHILRRIALTLDFAHSKGIVHGDLKPSNVFVQPDRRLKVADFAVSPRSWSTGRPMPPEWTHSYLSPEHFLSRDTLGKSADQYALAAIAYHMYTGQAPFGAAPRDLAFVIPFGEIPPPTGVRPQLPKSVDQAFAKAFSRDPQQRYASCAELISFLEACFLQSESRPRRKWLPIAIPMYTVVAIVFALLAAILLLMQRSKGSQKPKTPDARVQTVPGTSPPATGKPGVPAATDSHSGAVQSPSKPSPSRDSTAAGRHKREPDVPPALANQRPSRDRTPPDTTRPAPPFLTPAAGPILPPSVAGLAKPMLDVFSRKHRIERGIGFSFRDPSLGELGYGDLTAVVSAGARAARGSFTVEWFVDGTRTDASVVTPNSAVEYRNEPTAGTYTVVLRQRSKELDRLIFRITP